MTLLYHVLCCLCDNGMFNGMRNVCVILPFSWNAQTPQCDEMGVGKCYLLVREWLMLRHLNSEMQTSGFAPWKSFVCFHPLVPLFSLLFAACSGWVGKCTCIHLYANLLFASGKCGLHSRCCVWSLDTHNFNYSARINEFCPLSIRLYENHLSLCGMYCIFIITCIGSCSLVASSNMGIFYVLRVVLNNCCCFATGFEACL